MATRTPLVIGSTTIHLTVSRPTDEAIADALAHLGASLVLTLPSDEPSITAHVIKAYRALGGDPAQVTGYPWNQTLGDDL
jgi:hypothetical protein